MQEGHLLHCGENKQLTVGFYLPDLKTDVYSITKEQTDCRADWILRFTNSSQTPGVLGDCHGFYFVGSPVL